MSATYTLRPARTEDVPYVEMLAQLDSQPRLHGPLLLAECDGNLVAAVEIVGGRMVADPFTETRQAERLLRERATHLRPSGQAQRSRGAAPWRWWLGLRAAD